MNKFKKLLLCGSFALFASSNVSAVPITGTMEMTGGFHAIDTDGVIVNDASLATGIDFDFFGFDMFRVTGGSGDFSSLAGQVGSITDFQFEPFAAPIVDFWTVDAFAFELTDVSRGFTNDPTNFLVLNGVGTISALGFDDTAANWSFTGDTTGNGIFSWSASSSVQADVPEPNMLFLLSLGLIAFGLRKRAIK